MLTIGKLGLFLGCLALFDKLFGIFCFLDPATLTGTRSVIIMWQVGKNASMGSIFIMLGY